MTQPEALRLADALQERCALHYMGDCKCGSCQLVPDSLISQAAAELRRLYEVNQELLEALKVLGEYAKTGYDCPYVALPTKFVRDIALPAIAKATGESK